MLRLAALAPLAAGMALFAPLPAEAQNATPIGPQAPATPTRFDHALSALPWQWAQGGYGPVEVDQSVGGPLANDGQPLRINGRTFVHGLGTASTSVIVYDLGGMALSFSSWVGVDDAVVNAGSVVFQVFTDGALRYQSPLLRGSDFAQHTGRLDMSGVRELMLVVLDGGDSTSLDHADWAEPTLLAHVPPVGNGVALRARRGQWEAPLAWPLVAMHATLFPNGKLVTHASRFATGPGTDAPGDPHDSTRADLADIATWAHTPIDHPSEELFASGHARLVRYGLMTAGGHAGRANDGRPFGRAQASRFASVLAGWLPVPPMAQARWGATALTLGDGSVLALGGAHAGGNAFVPEVFDGLAWRTLSTASTAGLFGVGDPRADDTFPMVHLAPDGRVLVAGWGTDLARLDLVGSGTFDLVVPRESVQRAFGTSVQIAPEHVLVIGGVDGGGVNAPAQRSVVSIDIGGAAPNVTSVAPMLFPRADVDATLLANGQVLVSGGAATHTEGDNPTAVRVAELYDPTNGRWELLAAARIAREHRSTALLLPDARVWTGGGCGASCTGASSAEVFQPPYLFASDGSPAPRPAITSAPTRVDYGAVFNVSLASAARIARATLVRLGSVTHGVNSDQRILSLVFTQSGNSLQLTAPAHGNLAPPGPYMLFVLDAAGTPSVAPTLELGAPSTTTWQTQASSDGSRPAARHEASMLTIGGRLYLMGGRGPRPVEEYDPVTRRWRSLGFPPLAVHHFQPVVLGGLVYVVGAFLGDYPNELNLGSIYTWDPRTNVWSIGPALPPGRERGGAGAVVYDGKIYLVAGNNQGHNGGARPWFDVFDPVTQQWTVLPDAPRARDHFMAVVVGNKLVLAGGRRTTLPNPFTNTVPEVDVYDFGAGTWSTLPASIPTRRAGTMAVGVGRHLVVAGGESDTQAPAHPQVEALDVLTGEWLTLPPLVEGRHSGGIGVADGRVYVVSGSGFAGGAPELDTVEVLDAARVLTVSSANLVVNGGFDQGLLGWLDQGDLVLVPDAGVAAPSLSVANGAALRVIPATPGSMYDLSALVRVSAFAGTAEVGFEFLDGGGVVLAQHLTPLAPSAALRTATASGVAPAGTAQLRMRAAASGARSVIVDDVVVLRR
jgi:hypothetical protein